MRSPVVRTLYSWELRREVQRFFTTTSMHVWCNTGLNVGNVTEVITDFGEPIPVQLPFIAGMYATSLWQQNEELHELSLTMFTSYKFTVLSSVALQYATGTHHSGNGVFNLLTVSGFPSEQTATSFTMAAAVDEAFGWKGGLPAYLVAGLIGWSEIDQDRHTVSDVVFGAALGFVVGGVPIAMGFTTALTLRSS